MACHSSSVGSLVYFPVLRVLHLQKALASRLLTSAGQSQGMLIYLNMVLSLYWLSFLTQKRGMVGLMDEIQRCPSVVHSYFRAYPPSSTNFRYYPLETSI